MAGLLANSFNGGKLRSLMSSPRGSTAVGDIRVAPCSCEWRGCGTERRLAREAWHLSLG